MKIGVVIVTHYQIGREFLQRLRDCRYDMPLPIDDDMPLPVMLLVIDIDDDMPYR